MQVLLRLLCLCLLPFPLPAQTLPLDPGTGKIIYAEEVLVKDGPQTDLYRRAKAWLQAFNKRKGSGITADDTTNGSLIGQNYTSFTVSEGSCADTCQVWFTLHITVADDRYWYRLDNLQLQKENPHSLPAAKNIPLAKQPLEEVLFSKNTPATKKEATYRQALAKQSATALLALIEDFKKNML